MKRSAGAWLPDDETDSVMLRAGLDYQNAKLLAALPYCRKARVAVDVGAHCGLWTRQLGNYFERVHAFEPLPRHIECWHRNAGWKKSCELHTVALGNQKGVCGLHIVDGSSGRSYINAGLAYYKRGGSVPMLRLDDFLLRDVDLLKVDVEGYERFVLEGAKNTLMLYKPVVVVEQKPGHAGRFGLSDHSAVRYLESMGAVVREEIVGDYIMSWDEA